MSEKDPPDPTTLPGGAAEYPSLSSAAWLRDDTTQRVFEALQRDGHVVRAVGGTVRNSLLGEPVTDIDLATTAAPADTIRAAELAGLKAIATGLAHGTITVVADHIPFEVTTLREDLATDGRHATVAFTDDWARDAARRDFTINALYCDADGRLFDPLDGYPDLLARRVRFIGNADMRIEEDYLRILRFFRFSARYAAGDALDREALSACVRGRAGLTKLSSERVRVELLKILVGPRPVTTLGVMRDWGILAGTLPKFVPNIARLSELVGCEAATDLDADPMRRLGALFLHHPGQTDELADALRLSNTERDALSGSSGRPMPQSFADAFASGEAADSAFAARVLAYRTGTDGALARLLRAGAEGRLLQETLSVAVAAVQSTQRPEFPLSGRDLIAIGATPGPALGELLATLEDAWIATDFSATRDALLEHAHELIENSCP